MAVKTDGIAELGDVVVDDSGQVLECRDHLGLASQPAIREVGDLKSSFIGRLGVDEAETKGRCQGEHIVMIAVDEFASEFAVNSRRHGTRRGLDPPADMVRAFKERHGESRIGQQSSRIEASDARSHHRDLGASPRRECRPRIHRQQPGRRSLQEAAATGSGKLFSTESLVFEPSRMKGTSKSGEYWRSPTRYMTDLQDVSRGRG